MCGIVGVWDLKGEPPSRELLAKMTRSLLHRGPDGEGYYFDGAIGFGHTRLAIIDLSPLGRQPMTTQDERYSIVYNGEVYNFRELRIELARNGHRFQSQTDSEVVLHAYAEWGERALERFNGMFALAVWDAKKRELFLARDRYGIKPLYYYHCGSLFVFASEIKAVRSHPRVTSRVDFSALLQYFTFQNVFTDQTLFQDVKLFPAGHYAYLKSDNPARLAFHRYWDFEFREKFPAENLKECEEELDRLFSQAVRRQLVSDVPVGAYLSGGMDSGAITAVAAREIPYLASFTCGFDLSSATEDELGADERERAEALSYRFKTELYEVVLKAGDMERAISNLVWHLEDLRLGQCYPNYYVSRLAGKFVKVVLAGTGGDELFAGYPWRYFKAGNMRDFDDYVEQYYVYWQRLVPNKIIHQLFVSEVWKQIKDLRTLDVFKSVMAVKAWDTAFVEESVNCSLYFEAKTFLHGLLLLEDKLSMSWGLESRVPFLDNDLVDFAMRIPLRYKLQDPGQNFPKIDENETLPKRAQKTKDGKIILRNVLGRYVPGEYVRGVKQGFSAPDATWFRKESREYIGRLFFDKRAKVYDYLRQDVVESLLNEHFSGKSNRRLLIWSLLCFEWWLAKFMA